MTLAFFTVALDLSNALYGVFDLCVGYTQTHTHTHLNYENVLIPINC